MKKALMLMLLAAPLALSCNPEKQIIKEVAYNYSFALANYNIDEAEKYATEETRAITLAMARNLVNAVGEEYIQSDTPATVEIRSVEIVNDTVAKAVYHKVTPIKDFTDTLLLRKREGEWRAHVLIPVVKKGGNESSSTAVKKGTPQMMTPEILNNPKNQRQSDSISK